MQLGNMKRATVNVFKGKAQINIREVCTLHLDILSLGLSCLSDPVLCGQEQWRSKAW